MSKLVPGKLLSWKLAYRKQPDSLATTRHDGLTRATKPICFVGESWLKSKNNTSGKMGETPSRPHPATQDKPSPIEVELWLSMKLDRSLHIWKTSNCFLSKTLLLVKSFVNYAGHGQALFLWANLGNRYQELHPSNLRGIWSGGGLCCLAWTYGSRTRANYNAIY